MSSLHKQLEEMLDVNEVVHVTSELVKIESHRDAPGRELRCAQRISQFFTDWGMKPEFGEVLEGRPNVYCVLKGSGGGMSLMLNGHSDTVPAYEMDFPPFDPQVKNGNLYGRGTVDMKGALACMMVAMRMLRDLKVPLKGDLVFSGVINEEDRSEGTEFLVRNGPHTDRCVVGEPTSLIIMVGHRGLEWLEFEFIGKAAHGGTPEKGINAISMAAKFIRRVEETLLPEMAKRVHPIIGPAVMNFGVIKGGTQPSTVADRCVVQIDRRWVPMEKLDRVLGEYKDILAELKNEDPRFNCTMTRMESNMATMDHMPVEIPVDDPLVLDLKASLVELGISEPRLGAFGGWTDASLIGNFAKIPTLIFGPGDLSVAHSRCEFVPVDDLRNATMAYALLAAALCNRSK
ncbi:MAG: M20 family metallopeptidase [Anaerolineales bacterium]|nr:M20 family metallopeptidase [Anaerolineales bacterium]